MQKLERARDVLREQGHEPLPAPRTFEDLRQLAIRAEPKHGLALETTQLLVPGLLVREIRIPAGTLLCGEVHRWEHVNTFCGDITVIDEAEDVVRYRGMHTVLGRPGARRIGFTHANTVWVTSSAIPAHITDPDEAAAYVVENPLALQSSRRPDLPMAPGIDVQLAPSPLP